MKQRIVAFDLDGTLLTCNSSFAFCRFLYQKKILSSFQLSYCLIYYFLHRGRFVSLRRMHEKVFDRLFRGKEIHTLQAFVEEFLETLDAWIYTPAFIRLKAALDQKEAVMIVSASPRFLVAPLAKRWGIGEAHGSEYAVDSKGRLGDITVILEGKHKADLLKRRAAEFEYVPSLIVYSDGMVDLPFLEAADIAVAVRPDKYLRQHALENGWEILS